MMTSLRALPLPLYADEDTTLLKADCKRVLKKMEDKSVALIIVDPPYGGHTHNQQSWDVAWSDEEWTEIIRESYRVLIPGGHMIVFSSGKSTLDINMSIINAYRTLFSKKPSYYPMIWVHNSQDSGRVHQHIPRSKFESMHVYYREGECKLMDKAGTFAKSYAFDQHVGRHNVFHFDKDDCHKKPFLTVQNFFDEHKTQGKHLSTFDYKPEALLRALIRDYSKPGHMVMDLCMRHGLTAVACKIERRQCVGVEIDGSAYELAVSRYIDQFGEKRVGGVQLDTDTEDTASDTLPCLTEETVIEATRQAEAEQLTLFEPETVYPRPRGRAPNGCVWSPETGEWLPMAVVLTRAKRTSKMKRKRSCDTPGCKLEQGHLGLCSCAVIGHKRSCGAA